MIVRLKPARAPHVRNRIHQPRGMQAHNRTRENSPQQERPSAEREQYRGQQDDWYVVIFSNPNVEFVFRKIGNVTARGVVSWCMDLPIKIQPICAHQVPSTGECGSPSLSECW